MSCCQAHLRPEVEEAMNTMVKWMEDHEILLKHTLDISPFTRVKNVSKILYSAILKHPKREQLLKLKTKYQESTVDLMELAFEDPNATDEFHRQLGIILKERVDEIEFFIDAFAPRPPVFFWE
jgi:hypothetical protein